MYTHTHTHTYAVHTHAYTHRRLPRLNLIFAMPRNARRSCCRPSLIGSPSLWPYTGRAAGGGSNRETLNGARAQLNIYRINAIIKRPSHVTLRE